MKLALVVCLLLCSSVIGKTKKKLKSASAAQIKPISITRNPILKLYRLLRGPPYDIVHVIDGSGSLDADDHDLAKDAAQMINMHYHSDVAFGAGGSRCALIKFSEPALTQIVFHLTTHTTLWQNHVAIGNLEFDAGGSTAIGLGLYYARWELFLYPRISKKRVWLFTDGQNNEWIKDPQTEADALKDTGAQLCIVGVGNNIDQNALENMASLQPNGELCLFIFGTVRDYKQAVKKALKMVEKDRRVQLRDLKRGLRRKA